MIQHNGKLLLKALKTAAGSKGAQLQLLTNDGLRLRPVATRLKYQCSSDVHCLTKWRNKFVSSFLTEFVASEMQTATWLDEKVGRSDDSILFMIDDMLGNTVGYMGLGYINWDESYGEADAVVRGRHLPRGSMSRALNTLISWGNGQLGIKNFGVRVRSDNTALEFYRKFGFIEKYRVALSQRTEDGKTTWYENPNDVGSHVSLVYHKFKIKRERQ